MLANISLTIAMVILFFAMFVCIVEGNILAACVCVLLMCVAWSYIGPWTSPNWQFLQPALGGALLMIELFFVPWIFYTIFIILILGCLAFDSEWWATGILIGGGLLWWWHLDWAWMGWREVANMTIYYLTAGLIFTFFKWYILHAKNGRKFKEYVAEQNNRKSPEDIARTFHSKVGWGTLTWNSDSSKYEFKYAKATLVGYLTVWTVYWPIYTVLILLEDIIKEFFHWFANVFGSLYQRIANVAYN